MKHVFIINPKAGARDISEYLINTIKNIFSNRQEDYHIHITTGENDARDFAKIYCLDHPNEHKRFYSCGGDGTLNEVLNGIVEFDNVSLTAYPCGSGNDFVKNFGEIEDFLNLENLIDGSPQKVDVIEFNGRFALNICNLGFDGEVAYNFNKFKRIRNIKGKIAYILAVVYSLFSKMSHKVQISTEDGVFYDGKILLAAIANGICYGGGFYCAPLAKVDDGLIDLIVVKKVSRFTFIKFVKYYKRGVHLEHPKLAKYIIHKKCKQVNFVSQKELSVSFDGEVIKTNKLNFSIIPNKIAFVIPKAK